ncbi:hypothetical protein [Leptospira idonii]|uniref:Uncharacterized protein n=1 Tax=Leptospira idonii TaxID=1193500 RepID=A0A4R9M5P4_9LEPT|nr:hypothetical protein [Leptospira idonii]TGN20529.1 hypothetical protein EHS15_02745 [Leptospira idonii]
MAAKFPAQISNLFRSSIFKTVSTLLFISLLGFPLFSQSYTVIKNTNPSRPVPGTLFDPGHDPKPFSFRSEITDQTDYPPITNTLTIFTGYDKLRALFGDGSNEVLKIVGEVVLYREVQGNVAVILTNKKLHAIDSSNRRWVSESLYGDERMQFKLGNNGITAKSDRRTYVYLSGWDSWKKNALEGEIVSGMSSLGNLATVITNKRVIVYSAANPEPIEEDILMYKIGAYQILSDSIVYTSGVKYYHYTDLLQKISLQEYRD